MVVQLSPDAHNLSESLCSLKFAARAHKVGLLLLFLFLFLPLLDVTCAAQKLPHAMYSCLMCVCSCGCLLQVELGQARKNVDTSAVERDAAASRHDPILARRHLVSFCIAAVAVVSSVVAACSFTL